MEGHYEAENVKQSIQGNTHTRGGTAEYYSDSAKCSVSQNGTASRYLCGKGKQLCEE